MRGGAGRDRRRRATRRARSRERYPLPECAPIRLPALSPAPSLNGTRRTEIIAVVRRDGAPVDLFGVASDKVQVTVVDYNRLAETARESFANVDVAFSCCSACPDMRVHPTF